MNNVVLNLNLNEAQVLLQLIDLAIKSQGLNVAEAGVVLSRKIQESLPKQGSDGQAGQSGPTGPDQQVVDKPEKGSVFAPFPGSGPGGSGGSNGTDGSSGG